MSGMELNEPVINAVVARLKAGLPAAIATLNDTLPDDEQLADIETVFDFMPPPGFLTELPAIGVGEGPSTFADDIGSSATGHHSVVVIVYVADADQQQLARRLRRYRTAIARVILEGRHLDGAAWGVKLERTIPGLALADDKDPQTWLSWTAIEISARREEE